MSTSVDVKVLKEILSNLITVPESLEINREIDEQGVCLSMKVHGKDMGLAVGRSASMINALRTVMKGIGKANNMNIRLVLLEPDESTKNVNGDDNIFITDSIKEEEKNIDNSLSINSDLEDLIIN